MTALEPDDYQLSMAVSPRARREENNEGLRSMLVHRFSDTTKAIWRRALRNNDASVYCEGCKRWTRGVRQAAMIWTCEHCERQYRIEFVVYEEVDPA